MKASTKYEFLEHTGDIGLKVYGEDIKTLFANAAEGFFSIMTDVSQIQPLEKQTIWVEGMGLDEVLVNWLNKLNYLFATENKLFCRFQIHKVDENSLEATIQGESIDPQRHQIIREVKAATYHNLEIRRTNDHWMAQIIFDL